MSALALALFLLSALMLAGCWLLLLKVSRELAASRQNLEVAESHYRHAKVLIERVKNLIGDRPEQVTW